MKGKMDYKAKRNIAIIVIVLALFIIASVSTYVYLRGNTETKAVSEINSMTENQNASQEEVGESQEVQNNQEQTSSEPATTEENNETQEVVENNATEVAEVTTDSSVSTTTTSRVPNTQAQASQTVQTQPETTTETKTETDTGFTSEDGNIGALGDLTGNIPTDTTAPVYTAMGIFNWTNENIDKEDVAFATANEHIRLFVAFPEMLAVNPKVDIYGENGTVTTMDLEYSEAAKFYFVEFDTTDDLKLPQGKIQFRIYGYADAAGNVGEDLTDNDTTDSRYLQVVYDTIAPEISVKDGCYINTNISPRITEANLDEATISFNDGAEEDYPITNGVGREISREGKYTITITDKAGNKTTVTFVVDKTAPKATKVQLWDKENGETETIRNGQTVRVMATFDEKLGTEPTLTIGEQTVRMEPISDGKGGTIYQADITIAEDEVTIPEGRLPFTISGYADEAGNVGEDITEESENVTGIIYDRTAPMATFTEITSTSQFNNQYAKVGDEVWVKVAINEASSEMSQYPVIKINGQIVETFINDENEAGTVYAGKLVMTKDMEEGVVTFEISGYADKAGNVGETLTTTTNGTSVTFDKTKPVVTGAENGKYYNTDVTLNIEDANPGTIHLHKDGKNTSS